MYSAIKKVSREREKYSKYTSWISTIYLNKTIICVDVYILITDYMYKYIVK